MRAVPGYGFMKKLILFILTVMALMLVICISGCSAISSNRAIEHYNRGVTLNDAGKYDEAIIEYNQAIEIDSNYANAYINRGYAYYHKKQYDLAIIDYTKAIDLNPEVFIAYNGRGASYLMTKQYQQAITDFDKSIKINPDQAQIIASRDYAATMLSTTTTTLPPTTLITPIFLNGDWLDRPSNFGLSLFDGGSRWNYNVELNLQEEGTGKFHGSMKRTLVEITGPMTTEPEIMKWIGDIQTSSVSGTRIGSNIEFIFGELTLHLTVDSDSYGVYLHGDTHFFDTGSAVDNFKGLLADRPPGVSGEDYIEWIYTIDLRRK